VGPIDWKTVLGECSQELGIDLGRARAIEVASRQPLLTDAFVAWKVREFLTLSVADSANPDWERWASRYPQSRFFVGSLSTFAHLTAGRFDWASMLEPVRSGSDPWSPLPELARLLRKRGCLFFRADEMPADRWHAAQSCHERWQLKIVSARPLGDGTVLLASRRR
jgi:hypothetical protein